MLYRTLNGHRKPVRCDACRATDGTVLECLFPYAAAAATRYDEQQSIAPGAGQFYDLCQDCRQIALAVRQRFTDDRGVGGILRECCGSGTGNAPPGGLAGLAPH